MSRKSSMCGKKYPFPTKKTALKAAEAFNQRVYECPICFCWHCTSKERWQDEFISIDRLEAIENDIRHQYKKKIKTAHMANMDLQKENKNLRNEIKSLKKLKGIDDVTENE